MSAREFGEWLAYYRLEPFGEMQADLRAGIQAALFANANRDTEKQREPFQPADFFMTLPRAKEKRRKRAKWEEIFEKMKMIGQQKHR